MVNTIVDNFIEQVDKDEWDTGLVEDFIASCSNPNMEITKGESFYYNKTT